MARLRKPAEPPRDAEEPSEDEGVTWRDFYDETEQPPAYWTEGDEWLFCRIRAHKRWQDWRRGR